MFYYKWKQTEIIERKTLNSEKVETGKVSYE